MIRLRASTKAEQAVDSAILALVAHHRHSCEMCDAPVRLPSTCDGFPL